MAKKSRSEKVVWEDGQTHYKLTDDGTEPGESGLPIALYSCNVVIARFRTIETAKRFAVCSAEELYGTGENSGS